MRLFRTCFHRVRQLWSSHSTSNPALKWSQTILFWLPTGIVFTKYGYTMKLVTGRSMQPTLNPDESQWRDLVIFDRLSVGTLHRYEREDVVALRSPHALGQLLVKRIIALPGDIVKTLPPYPDKEVVIPQGHVWVEGDESFHTEDSNHFGPVPLALIDSKLAFIIWPWDRRGPLRRPLSTVNKKIQGPTWRVEQAELERERRRRARVTV